MERGTQRAYDLLRIWRRAFVPFALLTISTILPGATGPKIDKAKLETYLRYIEGYTAGVKFAIDDPTPSAYKGFSRVVVHLSMPDPDPKKGDRKIGDRIYYVTPDGEHFLSGALWDLSENPFADTLAHLPLDGPSIGPANARVVMVVFSDFECPYCREFGRTLRTNLAEKYPNDVRVIFKDFPIDSIHPWARAASEAAHCLGAQKPEAFWVFHDWAFEHQQEVNAENLKEKTLALAKDQGLDTEKVASCIDTRQMAKVVEDNLAAGRALQIQQTPTTFINGRMVPGALSWKDLNAVIQMELNRPKEIPGPSTAKCCEAPVPTIVKK